MPDYEKVGSFLVAKDETPDQRLVFCEAYAPMCPDSDGDVMSQEDIQKMAHSFMVAKKLDKIDVQHDNKTYSGLSIVESFIARKGDDTFLPGSWVVGIHVNNDAIWEKIKKGEINGVSIEALVSKTPHVLDIDIPPVVNGRTTKAEDHEHEFFVTFDNAGKFMGGRTNIIKGHYHDIRAGTVTMDSDGVGCGNHSHRFSFVEGFNVPSDIINKEETLVLKADPDNDGGDDTGGVDKDNDACSFPLLASTLMEARNITHKLHLATHSYAKHSALDALYKALPDLTDALIESWMGKYGVIPVYPAAHPLESGDPVSFIDSLSAFFTSCRQCIPQRDTELQNAADEIQTEINDASYKLKNLS